MHTIFHVLLLYKYVSDLSHVLRTLKIELVNDLIYEERLVQIQDWRIEQLMNWKIPLIKVLWNNYKVNEATWEVEQDIKDKYLKLFLTNFKDGIPTKRRNCNTHRYISEAILSFSRILYVYLWYWLSWNENKWSFVFLRGWMIVHGLCVVMHHLPRQPK